MPVRSYRKFALFACLSLAFSAQAKIIFVDTNAIGLNHGQSWQNAYKELQTGLNNAQSGDEIWVADGTYYPTADGNRSLSFEIPAGVQIYGGFAGGFSGEFQRSLRRWHEHPVILSGNISDANSATDNSYHVVVMGEDALIDGFTVRDGYADGTHALDNGGGIFAVDRDNCYIRNCIIRNNHAAANGGGVYTDSQNPRVATCLFIQNSALNGAAVYVSASAGTRLANCTITNNHSSGTAGGLFSFNSPVRISNSILWGNTPIEMAGIQTVVRHSIIAGGWTQDDSINVYDADPLFADSANEDYHLSSLSPAVDAGNAEDIPQDFPQHFGVSLPFDYEHNERRRDLAEAVDQGPPPAPAVDLGIFEFPGFTGIGNRVWQDANNNGVQDEGEPGVAGIQVNHIDVNRSPNPIATTFTDADGFYSFTDVRAGPHIIEFAIGPLRQFTTQDIGDDRFDSDANPNTGRAAITLEENQTTFGIDAGVMATHFFVNPAATDGANNGSSWGSAFLTIDKALETAVDGDEIWIVAGNYIPSGFDRDASFTPRPGVSLYGGFAGSESQREQRNWRNNPTTLSGGRGLATHTDNCYHVLTANIDITVDGFTIRDGNADGPTDRGNGGGIYVPPGGTLFIANCELRDNLAAFGAGVFGSDAHIEATHVIAYANSASFGGAFYLENSSSSFIHSVFHGNTGLGGGGAIFADLSSTPVITNSILYSNGANALAADSATVSYSIVENGWPAGTAIVDSDPLFANSAARDFRLTLHSPGIDAGDNSVLPEDALDFNLRPRRWDIVAIPNTGNGLSPLGDIGAFEFPGSGSIGGLMWNDRNENGVRDDDDKLRIGNTVILRNAAKSILASATTGSDGRYEFVDLPSNTYVIEFERPGSRNFTHENLGDDDRDSDADTITGEAVINLAPASSRLHVDAGVLPAVIYVNHLAITGSNDGASWLDAFVSLQAALDESIERDEIWVAVGIYTPGGDGFICKSETKLYGGFAGGETSIDQRAWWDNPTELRADGAVHTVTAASDVVLDGFTIRDGNADSATAVGGGVLLDGASDVRIANCIIRNNIGQTGGGLACLASSLTLVQTQVVRNIGGDGAGIYLDADSAITIEHCVIANNLGSGFGAGIRAIGAAAPDLSNSIVWSNSPDNFSAPNTTAVYCIIQGGWAGAGNLDTDPLFANAPSLDYRLNGDSPAIDAGSNFSATAELELDAGGGPRFVNYQGTADTGLGSAPIVDIGAYEVAGAWLGDFIWHDANNDGIQDPGEPGGIGFTINLLNASGTAVLDSVLSDSNGNYRFTGLEPGAYVLEFIVPAARGFTLRDQGGDDELDSDPNLFTGRIPVTLAHNEIRLSIDTGLATETVRVKPGANGLANGDSWLNAYPNLADALASTFDGDEIWVAAGTYTPSLVGDRSATFVARPGVKLLGGFAGFEEDASQRYYWANPTILSGDIGTQGVATDNSYHVLTVHTNATIHGFTIRDGRADGSAPHNNGGGALVLPAVKAATILDCDFISNYALFRGGGIYTDDGPLIVTNCDFTDNEGRSGGGGILATNTVLTLENADFVNNRSSYSGAGIFLDVGTAFISDCTFSNNTVTGFGAAIITLSSRTTIQRVNMTGNTALQGAAIFQRFGTLSVEDISATNNNGGPLLFWQGHADIRRGVIDGNTGVGVLMREASGSLILCDITDNRGSTGAGIECITSSPTLINCNISANQSTNRGGGIYVSEASAPVLWNCLIADNLAVEGAGMYLLDDASPQLVNCTIANNIASSVGGGIFATAFPQPSLKNCIVADNHPSAIIAAGGSVYRSIVEGQSTAAMSDVWQVDPAFVAQGDYRLQASSPAIDRGDNSVVPLDLFDIDDDGIPQELIPIDLGGLPRLLNRSEVPDNGLGVPPYIDLGAYELGDPAIIGDFVWHDVNGSGTQDLGENGIEGVTVRLLDAEDAELATTVTDRSGAYQFEVPVGDFRLEFEPPAIFLFTELGLGGNTALDSDVSSSTGRSPLITLGSGEANLDIDVGLVNGPGLFTFNVHFTRGWNLLSLPYELIDPTRTTSRLADNGLSAPYGWADGAYYRETAMSAKRGYFVHNARAPFTLTFFGPAANLPRVSLLSGWNLIGITGDVSAASTSTRIFDPVVPALGAPVFGFDGTFRSTSVLQPGLGYWINRQ